MANWLRVALWSAWVLFSVSPPDHTRLLLGLPRVARVIIMCVVAHKQPFGTISYEAYFISWFVFCLIVWFSRFSVHSFALWAICHLLPFGLLTTGSSSASLVLMHRCVAHEFYFFFFFFGLFFVLGW